jgi:hypothetical protein
MKEKSLLIPTNKLSIEQLTKMLTEINSIDKMERQTADQTDFFFTALCLERIFRSVRRRIHN